MQVVQPLAATWKPSVSSDSRTPAARRYSVTARDPGRASLHGRRRRRRPREPSARDRATIANMSPEFGATATLFRSTTRRSPTFGSPDATSRSWRSWRPTRRPRGLWRLPGAEPVFDEELSLDLAAIEPSLAGPRRPQTGSRCQARARTSARPIRTRSPSGHGRRGESLRGTRATRPPPAMTAPSRSTSARRPPRSSATRRSSSRRSRAARTPRTRPS